MLRKQLLWICCVVSLPVFGATVDLGRPSLQILSAESVKEACGGKVGTACTTFLESAINCFCEFKHGRWAPTVSITSKPAIYVSHQTYLHHEMSHVFDFREAMERFAEKVEDQAFQAKGTCDTFALDAMRVFPQVLADYRRASMVMRDGMVEGK